MVAGKVLVVALLLGLPSYALAEPPAVGTFQDTKLVALHELEHLPTSTVTLPPERLPQGPPPAVDPSIALAEPPSLAPSRVDTTSPVASYLDLVYYARGAKFPSAFFVPTPVSTHAVFDTAFYSQGSSGVRIELFVKPLASGTVGVGWLGLNIGMNVTGGLDGLIQVTIDATFPGFSLLSLNPTAPCDFTMSARYAVVAGASKINSLRFSHGPNMFSEADTAAVDLELSPPVGSGSNARLSVRGRLCDGPSQFQSTREVRVELPAVARTLSGTILPCGGECVRFGVWNLPSFVNFELVEAGNILDNNNKRIKLTHDGAALSGWADLGQKGRLGLANAPRFIELWMHFRGADFYRLYGNVGNVATAGATVEYSAPAQNGMDVRDLFVKVAGITSLVLDLNTEQQDVGVWADFAPAGSISARMDGDMKKDGVTALRYSGTLTATGLSFADFVMESTFGQGLDQPVPGVPVTRVFADFRHDGEMNANVNLVDMSKIAEQTTFTVGLARAPRIVHAIINNDNIGKLQNLWLNASDVPRGGADLTLFAAGGKQDKQFRATLAIDRIANIVFHFVRDEEKAQQGKIEARSIFADVGFANQDGRVRTLDIIAADSFRLSETKGEGVGRLKVFVDFVDRENVDISFNFNPVKGEVRGRFDLFEAFAGVHVFAHFDLLRPQRDNPGTQNPYLVQVCLFQTSCPTSSLVQVSEGSCASQNLLVSGVFTLLLCPQPGNCHDRSVLRLYQDIDYGGGCKAMGEGSDASFDDSMGARVFDNGRLLNNEVSSLKLKPGYLGELYNLPNFAGATLAFTGNLGFVGASFNDIASAAAVVTRCSEDSIVRVYELPNFGGGCKAFMGTDRDLTDNRFSGNPISVNDAISSIKVRPGYRIVLFEHPNFGGETSVWFSDASAFAPNEDNKASAISVDPLCTGSTPVQAFFHADLGGGCLPVFDDVLDMPLEAAAFHDQISSLVVATGYRALLCEHEYLGGVCTEYAGTVTFVGAMNDKASSIHVRPV